MSGRACSSAIFVLLALAAGGCSDAGTGPEEPDVPSVAGTWTGSFRDGSVRLTLSQAGSQVTGTLAYGRSEQGLTGSVDAEGVFLFSTDVAATDCVAYSTARGLQLESVGEKLNGVMVRTSKSPPCDAPGRTLVEQGSAALTRAF